MNNLVGNVGKVGGINILYTDFGWVDSFARNFAGDLHGVFQIVLHVISTIWTNFLLAIDFFLDFFDLVAQCKIELEIFFDFFDAVHDGGVIFDADFGGDFVGAEI